ncbi:hypothetical protein Phum_PHUM024020 [Pediculus humanus corporis]|uniref:Uncharacterized protein n=1 Tax=Pediculus humanus subsp. corporis TaxID=121224 RepID=E0V9X8_PEDHC|nr:uncharacterized protein Phum_PHUM024020 [Pediculus humanus corporis]EEB10184.1 hypothetical protein Phum_PHUM024020 [Pediculus humanus corporis]
MVLLFLLNVRDENLNGEGKGAWGCSCGPECSPDKCEGRNRSVLLGWDSLRTKIFLCLFAVFVVWLVVYVSLSLTVLSN